MTDSPSTLMIKAGISIHIPRVGDDKKIKKNKEKYG